MILLYHKVDLEAKTAYWVTADTFYKQMLALQAYDVVSLEDYNPANPRHAVITFDGIYENVFLYAFPILQQFGYPFELFVVGSCIGQGNEFDSVEPYAKFASMKQLQEMGKANGKIQWHTNTHTRLDKCSAEQIEKEVAVPHSLANMFSEEHFTWFAYPHGEVNDAIVSCAKNHFTGAVSCVQGNSKDPHLLNRTTVTEGTNLFTATVSVIIPNYNYGHLLLEALDSVKKQTVQPDEILIIDDASTDSSHEILALIKDDVTIVKNEKNLGTVQNFRKAVELTSGDFIAFLGADNRMRCDYIEKSRAVLDAHPDACVAYTDMLVFGDLANILATKIPMTKIYETPTSQNSVHIWNFPPPEEGLEKFATHNFIHGSSMYRRIDYERVGGYRETPNPEDYDFFKRMLTPTRKAYHVPHPVIEYRQHSLTQRNNLVSSQMEINNLRQILQATLYDRHHLRVEIEKLIDINKKLVESLESKDKKLEKTLSLLSKISDAQ